jgi:predicted AlkP superfamily phosphohydrolase/phosphomutase
VGPDNHRRGQLRAIGSRTAGTVWRAGFASARRRPGCSTGAAFFRALNASLCSAIRINVVGREPAGVVAPGEEYEELGSALEAELLGLVNVETGKRAVRRVRRPAEQFNGPKVPQMPDLLVEWHQESPIRSLASPTVGRVEGEYQGHRTGDH